MADENKIDGTEPVAKTRRTVVTTAAKVAVTAPAVGMLLSASTVPAGAQTTAYQASQLGILDDFTFGNTKEDVDAIALGSNFNPLNGTPQLDDSVPT